MSKYGRSKFGKYKYGRYDLGISTDLPLSQITRYRLRTIGSTKELSESIVNILAEFPTGAPTKVRLRSDSGQWVTCQSITLDGDPATVRVRSVGENSESTWTTSVSSFVRVVPPLPVEETVKAGTDMIVGNFKVGQKKEV